MPLRNVSNPTQVFDPNTGRNRTGVHLSTNIYLAIDGKAIAAVQKISTNEKRTVKMIDEVGTDGHIDSAPTKSADITGSCELVRFNGRRILEAFHRGYVHVSAQRTPFNIEMHDVFRGDENNTIVTIIENVWITNVTVNYSATDFIIAETMQWEAENIHSFMSGGGSAIYDPSQVEINPFERQADIGQYRGALDAAGLINAFDGSAL